MSTTINTTGWFTSSESSSGAGDGGNSYSSDTLPSATLAVYNRKMLKVSYPYLMHQKFGQQHPLGQRKGQAMIFRRWEKLDQRTTPLTEGVTPAGAALVKRDYVATLKQYGNYTVISDWVDMTHVDPVLSIASERMGENMGESMDSVYREALVAGTNLYRVTADGTSPTHNDEDATSARTEVAGCLTKAVIDAAIRDLKGQDAKPFTPMIAGSTRVASAPIPKAFWALIHSDQEHDFYQNESGFTVGSDLIPVQNYASHTGTMENEVCAYRNVRFVTSTNTKVWADSGASVGATGLKSTSGTSIDVYATLIFARDAYAIVPMQRGSAKTIIHRAGGNMDPLNQRNTVGWKAAGVAKILNDSWMIRIESGTLAS